MTATPVDAPISALPIQTSWHRVLSNRRAAIGGTILVILLFACVITLPFTLRSTSNFYFDLQHPGSGQLSPKISPTWMLFGTTKLGQSLLGRCLAGGVISLTVGIAAAGISVFLGVA